MPKINTSVITDKSITKEKLNDELQKKINNIGNLHYLRTNDKDSLVNAINELFQSASNGKTLVANAITGKGVQSNSNMTFQQLATNISNIKTGYTKEEIINNGIATRYKVEVVSEQEVQYYGNNKINRLQNCLTDYYKLYHGSTIETVLHWGKTNHNSLLMYKTDDDGYHESDVDSDHDYWKVAFKQYMDFSSFKFTSDGLNRNVYRYELNAYEAIPNTGQIDYGEIFSYPTRVLDGNSGTYTEKSMISLKTMASTYGLLEIPHAFYCFGADANKNEFTTIVKKQNSSGNNTLFKTTFRVVMELVDANGNVI